MNQLLDFLKTVPSDTRIKNLTHREFLYMKIVLGSIYE
jgi:hypothetical protein